MNEFSLIQKYFYDSSFSRKDVIVGVGDDAAVTKVADNQLLATTTDTLVQGIHFLEKSSPEDIAHKSIAVNMSDLAAMGAEPSWISLSLSLPDINEQWLEAFSNKIKELTEYYSVELIGGDTVKGPLSITITAQGFVPERSVITRSGAQNGDWIFVTGTLGDAGAGLDVLSQKLVVQDYDDKQYLIDRHRRPTPRVIAGTALRRLATSCIDISDGLLQDVMHIAKASDTGVMIDLDKLPISGALGRNVAKLDDALKYACISGDDYELLFTISEEHRTIAQTALDSYSVPYTCIGQMTGAVGKLDLRLDGERFEFSDLSHTGFQHF